MAAAAKVIEPAEPEREPVRVRPATATFDADAWASYVSLERELDAGELDGGQLDGLELGLVQLGRLELGRVELGQLELDGLELGRPRTGRSATDEE